MPTFHLDRRAAIVLALAFALCLAWDASGLDVALAHATGGGPQGFALRDDWLLSNVLHDGARRVGWLFVVVLCFGIARPAGPLVGLPFGRRLQLPASVLLATGVVVLLKGSNHTSCPWDLADFGGVARHLSHWAGWRSADGGAGRCFPAGHASTGFAFIGGWFALREARPRLARLWLVAAVVAGLSLGLVQQWRGAHFMSHTLWTGWLCAVVAWLSDPLFARLRVPAAPEVAR